MQCVPLEGNFDVLWALIIDNAFVSPWTTLHRKEKGSSLSANKFDGLCTGGNISPQEWVVIEVGRTCSPGTKQISDRLKLHEHCLCILNHRRKYLSEESELSGQQLQDWLRKFPVWGILCQGLSIKIFKMVWLTRGVGVITKFAGRFPDHLAFIEDVYLIMKEVHGVVVCMLSRPIIRLTNAGVGLGV